MSDKIPEDVMKTVAKEVRELDDTIWKNGDECGISHGLAGRVLVRLIMAERERAAEAAGEVLTAAGYSLGAGHALAVLDAIRNPSPEAS